MVPVRIIALEYKWMVPVWITALEYILKAKDNFRFLSDMLIQFGRASSQDCVSNANPD